MARALTLTEDSTQGEPWPQAVMLVDRRTQNQCISQLERLGLATWALHGLAEAVAGLAARRPQAIVLAATLAQDDLPRAWQLAGAAREAGVPLLVLCSDAVKGAQLVTRLGATGLLEEQHFSRDVSSWLSRMSASEEPSGPPPAKEWIERMAPTVPLDALLAVEFSVLARALPALAEELQGLVRLFDGRRTVADVVRDSELGEALTLEATTRFLLQGIVTRVKPPAKELVRFKAPPPALFGVPVPELPGDEEQAWGAGRATAAPTVSAPGRSAALNEAGKVAASLGARAQDPGARAEARTPRDEAEALDQALKRSSAGSAANTVGPGHEEELEHQRQVHAEVPGEAEVPDRWVRRARRAQPDGAPQPRSDREALGPAAMGRTVSATSNAATLPAQALDRSSEAFPPQAGDRPSRGAPGSTDAHGEPRERLSAATLPTQALDRSSGALPPRAEDRPSRGAHGSTDARSEQPRERISVATLPAQALDRSSGAFPPQAEDRPSRGARGSTDAHGEPRERISAATLPTQALDRSSAAFPPQAEDRPSRGAHGSTDARSEQPGERSSAPSNAATLPTQALDRSSGALPARAEDRPSRGAPGSTDARSEQPRERSSATSNAATLPTQALDRSSGALPARAEDRPSRGAPGSTDARSEQPRERSSATSNAATLPTQAPGSTDARGEPRERISAATLPTQALDRSSGALPPRAEDRPSRGAPGPTDTRGEPRERISAAMLPTQALARSSGALPPRAEDHPSRGSPGSTDVPSEPRERISATASAATLLAQALDRSPGTALVTSAALPPRADDRSRGASAAPGSAERLTGDSASRASQDRRLAPAARGGAPGDASGASAALGDGRPSRTSSTEFAGQPLATAGGLPGHTPRQLSEGSSSTPGEAPPRAELRAWLDSATDQPGRAEAPARPDSDARLDTSTDSTAIDEPARSLTPRAGRATLASPARATTASPQAPAPAPTARAGDWDFAEGYTYEPLRKRPGQVSVREALADGEAHGELEETPTDTSAPEELLNFRSRSTPVLVVVAIAALLSLALLTWSSFGAGAAPPSVARISTEAPEPLTAAEPVDTRPSVLAQWQSWELPDLGAASAPEPETTAEDLAAPLQAATALYEAGRLREASAALEALVAENPTAAPAWVLLGQVKFDARDLPAARAAAAQALSLDPKLARAVMLQATLALDAKDLAAAKEALERALAIDPQGPDAADARALLAHGL